MQVYRSETDSYQPIIGLEIVQDLGDTDISTLRKYYPGRIAHCFNVDGTILSLPKDFTIPVSDNFEKIVFLDTNGKGKPYIVAYGIVDKTQNEALRIVQSIPSTPRTNRVEIGDPSEWGLGQPRHQQLRRA